MNGRDSYDRWYEDWTKDCPSWRASNSAKQGMLFVWGAATAAERERWRRAATAALEVMDDLPCWHNAGHACALLRELMTPNV